MRVSISASMYLSLISVSDRPMQAGLQIQLCECKYWLAFTNLNYHNLITIYTNTTKLNVYY